MLKKNRSAPNTAVIPVLYYPDVREAVEWLTTALPFTERLRIGDHRCQLLHGNGAIVVATPGGHADAAPSTLQSPGGALPVRSVAHITPMITTKTQGSLSEVIDRCGRPLPLGHSLGRKAWSTVDSAVDPTTRHPPPAPGATTGPTLSWLVATRP